MDTIIFRLFILTLLLGSSSSFAAVSSFAALDEYQYLQHEDGVLAYRSFGAVADSGPGFRSDSGSGAASKLQSGSATPLFLLNGGPGRTSDSFTVFAKTLSAQGRQVIIFDQRGTGRSKLKVVDETTVTLTKMIQDIEALRKHLGFDKISILGHSFGGMYGMSYAAKYPKRVQRLVLSASGGVDLSWQQYANTNMLSRLSEAARAEYAYWTNPEQIDKDPAKARLEALRILLPAYVYRQRFLPEIAEAVLKPEYSNFDINGLVWQDLRKQKYDLRKAFRGLSVSTLVIDCRQDFLGEAVPMTIQASIPGARLEFLNECSHYPFIEKPKDYFILVGAFLTWRS